ncbi:hypothetical protein BVRB_3g052880 [Beta vulgaris subsp. vulgaris]|nr:hypothetical protein BVRB_3g052880 [Beta vulgaris subsp. vulgaris]
MSPHAAAVQSSIKCVDHEREALLQFKKGIQLDVCDLLTSWGEQQDCCQWRGIRCSNLTGNVIMLHLPGGYYQNQMFCSLQGQGITSIFELKHLKYLDLSSNDFSDQLIPESIDYLTNLEHLNLSYSGFMGRIPETLGNLTKLASLDLSGNYNYDSHVQSSLRWLSHLSLLKYINLSDIDLSKATNWVQIINNLPFLRTLYMENCQLSSTIPSPLSYINSSTSLKDISLSGNHLNHTWIFQWLFNLSRKGNELVHLDLSHNSFSWPLPSEFGEHDNQLELVLDSFSNLTSLRVLNLSYNNIHGFPYALSNLRSLRVLSLSYNNLHGSFSKNLSNLCNLQELHLDNNNLGDDLSNVIHILSIGCANKPRLEYLDLSMNKFWGSIPDIISTFSSIRELHLSGNYLNGTISQGIGQLSMLEILDVSNSSLKDTLNHNHFLHLSRLRELYLSDNSALVLNISTGWIPPFQLDIISLRSCNLGPYFPNWLLNQTNFSYLDISNGQISGSIPTDFWTKSLSSNLQSLSMSHNKITGALPNLNLSATFNTLTKIDLSSNYLEGAIPLFFEVGFHNASYIYLNNNKFTEASHLLCPKTNNYIMLELLDLSHNLLSGELPDCWMKLDQLESLHLENNKFSGTIPTSIGALSYLRYLHLNNNNFSGEFPASLENCTSLIVLDLGYNSLTGYIPSSIGNALTLLSALQLRRNKFFGSLPWSFCQLSNLQILDLAMNNISGIVPKCIHNLTAMTDESNSGFPHLGVSYSTEETSIMWKREEQIFRNSLMQLVKSIDLSFNKLQRDIPDGITSLKGLINLDLSRNNLSGRIPSNIGQLKSLDFLDLSNNHLSGEIPISLADVSRLGTLDLSYNNLSGKIPLSTQLQGFSSSSYMGNTLLCGAPLRECAGDKQPTNKPNTSNTIRQDEHGDGDFYLGLCISVVLGFIIGFWGVCGSIVLKRSWRHAFFHFFDDMKDKLYGMLWRKP